MSEIPLHLLLGKNWTPIEVRDFVSQCFSRDALLMTLLNFAGEWLEGRLVCVVTRDDVQPFMARGWASWGDDAETTEEMSQVKLPIDDSVVLRAIVDQGTYTIGSPEKLGFARLFEETPVMMPDELVVIPLQLGGNTKMLLVGDARGATDDLMAFSERLQPLAQVADEVSQQLEIIIKLAKANKLPNEDARIPPLPARVAGRQLSDVYEDNIEDEISSQESLMQAVSHALDASDSAMSHELSATVTRSEVDATQEVAQAPPTASIAAPGAEIDITPRARKTLPIKLDTRSTSRHPSLTTEQVHSDRAVREPEPQPTSSHIDVGKTLTATPLEYMHRGMVASEDEEKSGPSSKVNVKSLPPSPFDEDYVIKSRKRPKPMSIDPSRKDVDDPGVAIIAPIGLEAQSSRAKQTLMGGFSLEDLERAKEAFEFESRSPSDPKITLSGLSDPVKSIQADEDASSEEAPAHGFDRTPSAKVLRPAKALSKPRPEDEFAPLEEEHTPHHDKYETMILGAIDRNNPPEFPAANEREDEVMSPPAALEAKQEFETQKMEAIQGPSSPSSVDDASEANEAIAAASIASQAIEEESESEVMSEEQTASPAFTEAASGLFAAPLAAEDSEPKTLQGLPDASFLHEEDEEDGEGLPEISDPKTLQGLPEIDSELLRDPEEELDRLPELAPLSSAPMESASSFGTSRAISGETSTAHEDSPESTTRKMGAIEPVIEPALELDPTSAAEESEPEQRVEIDAPAEEEAAEPSEPAEDNLTTGSATMLMVAVSREDGPTQQEEPPAPEEPAHVSVASGQEEEEEAPTHTPTKKMGAIEGPATSSAPPEAEAEEAEANIPTPDEDVDEDEERAHDGQQEIEDVRKATMLMVAVSREDGPAQDAPAPAPEAEAEAEVARSEATEDEPAREPAPEQEEPITTTERPPSKKTLPMGTTTEEFDAFMAEQAALEQATPAREEAPERAGEPVAEPEPEGPAPLPIEVARALENLDSRDMKVSFAAADELIPHPEVFEQLTRLFPGRLYVDRYQWTPTKFPPPERHGPVIKAILGLGEECEPMLAAMLSHSGLDHRFYAAFLLTHVGGEGALEALYERLFDRDVQTRAMARTALLGRRHVSDFSSKILEPLRAEVHRPQDDVRTEQAGEFLGDARDRGSIEVLIEALGMQRGKIQRVLHLALQKITLQPLPPATIAWRTWYLGAKTETRSTWILRGLNSQSDVVRKLASEELAAIEATHGVEFGYHPDQPHRLRTRAQQQVKEWLEERGRL